MPSKERIENFIKSVENEPHDEVIEKFYAPNASIQENQNEPRVGLSNLIENERSMLKKAKSVHSEYHPPYFQQGNKVVIRWKFKFEWLDNTETEIEEIAYQIWEEEKILREHFFYDPKQFIPKSKL